MNKNLAKFAPFAAITLVGFLAYAGSFQNSFHYDDRLYITHNAAIRDLGNIKAMWDFFPSHSRFIALISFALNYRFHGLDVFGYHLTNVLIHIANAMLVWWMARALMNVGAGPRARPIKGDHRGSPLRGHENPIALAAALIFVAHPVQTQAVTYIAQRMTSLATLFYLLSVCLYIAGRARQNNKIALIACFAGSFLAAVAGMLTKEIVLTAPLAIVAIELMFLRSPENYKGISRKKMAVIAGVMLLPLLVVPAMYAFDFLIVFLGPHHSMSHANDFITLDKYIITQWRVHVKYLSLLFFPVGQNLDYDFPISHSLAGPAVLLSLALLVVLAALAVRLYKKQRLISFGIFWFFLALLPEYVPRQYVIFEHKAYLPSVGFSIAAAAGLFQLIKNPRIYTTALALIVVLLSFLSFQRNKVWKDDITLWQDAVSKSPHKASTRHNLGVAYTKEKRYEQALKEFNEVLRLEPTLVEAINYRGTLYTNLGKDDLAMQDYDAALAINPEHAEALYNKGLLLQKRGRLDEALEYYTKALQAKADYAAALNNRSGIYIERKQYEPAIRDMTLALAIDPYALTIYMNRARLYRITGRREEALKDYTRVLRIEPRHAQALILRAQTYFELDRLQEAKNDILRLKELKEKRR